MIKTYLFKLLFIVVMFFENSVYKRREPLPITGTMCSTEARIYLKENVKCSKIEEVYNGIIESYEGSGFNVNYGFAYITNDDIPELIVDLKEYWISVYTYKDGDVRAVMEQEPYGTWGRTYTYFEKTGIVKTSGYEFIDEYDGTCRQESFSEFYIINEKYELKRIDTEGVRGSNITKNWFDFPCTSPIDFMLGRRYD